MHTFIEAWTPNTAWQELPEQEQREFMDGIRTAISEMAEAGIVTLGWGRNDLDTPNRADAEFVAVWQAPSLDAIKGLESGVHASGWYDYFTQVNLRGALHPAEVIMDEHINLRRT